MKLQFIEAGQIVTTHGVRGEVKVLPWGGTPDFLRGFKRVRIAGTEYKVENCRAQKNCNLLKLTGVDSMDAGEALRDKIVEIYREDAAPGTIFADEVMGMDVYAGGKKLGKVTDVTDYPGNMVYEVTGEYEYQIPAVKQFIHSIDLDKNEMQVTVIEGMRSDED